MLSRLCSLLSLAFTWEPLQLIDSLGELDLLRLTRAERRGAELLELAFETVQLRVVGTLANDSGDIGPKSFLDLLWTVSYGSAARNSRRDVFVSSTVSCSTAACRTLMSVTPVEERMLATA